MANEFIISRIFDAPRAFVWKAFTEPARMKQWWGPKGFTVIRSDMDLRVGGIYHYGLKTPEGAVMWGKFVYREIVPPERMSFINSFSDEKGGVTRHPGHEKWPLEMLSTFTFEEIRGSQTKFTVNWSPFEATADEMKTFEMSFDSMIQGWTGTMDQLQTYLAKEE